MKSGQSYFLRWATVAFLFVSLETANAVEFQKLGSAIKNALGLGKKSKQKVYQTRVKKTLIFYLKGKKGKPRKIAVVEKGIYQPNCTHTWVVGLDSKRRVNNIQVVEMSCSHAFPTKEKSYLSQYKGKGPKQLKKLDEEIVTIAKATGSSELCTDAVKRAVIKAGKI